MNEPLQNQPPLPHAEGQNPQPYPEGLNPQPTQPGQGQSHQGQQLGSPYGQPQPGNPNPPLQRSLRPMSTRGPKNMTFIGGGILVIGIVALVLAIVGLVSVLPTGIIDGQGKPGSDALLSIEGPEPVSLDSSGGSSYTLWEVADHSAQGALSSSAVGVTGPDGEAVPARPPSVSAYNNRNGIYSQAFGEFRTSEPGAYLITVEALGGTDLGGVERVIVAEATGFGGLFAGVFSTVVLMIVGIGGGIVGFGLTVAGIIWWVTANNRNKRLAQ